MMVITSYIAYCRREPNLCESPASAHLLTGNAVFVGCYYSYYHYHYHYHFEWFPLLEQQHREITLAHSTSFHSPAAV